MTFPSDRTSTRAAASGPEAHPRPRPLTADLLERLQGVRDALPVESVMVRRHADDPGIEVLAGRRLFTEAERRALPFDSPEYSYSVVCAAVAVEPAPRLPLVGVGLGRIAADAVAALKARSAALLGDDEQMDRFAADVLGLRSGVAGGRRSPPRCSATGPLRSSAAIRSAPARWPVCAKKPQPGTRS